MYIPYVTTGTSKSNANTLSSDKLLWEAKVAYIFFN